MSRLGRHRRRTQARRQPLLQKLGRPAAALALTALIALIVGLVGRPDGALPPADAPAASTTTTAPPPAGPCPQFWAAADALRKRIDQVDHQVTVAASGLHVPTPRQRRAELDPLTRAYDTARAKCPPEETRR